MAQLFEELKRRNVIRVGAAYAIVGWLLIEVASVLLPTFNAPEWIMQVFALLKYISRHKDHRVPRHPELSSLI